MAANKIMQGLNTQISFFENQEFTDSTRDDYWGDNFGWHPEVGMVAEINDTVSYCIDTGKNRYTLWAEVEILEKEGNYFIVSFTKNWKNRTYGTDPCGTKFKVHKYALKPSTEDKN